MNRLKILSPAAAINPAAMNCLNQRGDHSMPAQSAVE